MLQESFLKSVGFEEDLSVDEMIVHYYGHNIFKQFMRGKPIRFGYKFWALCGVSGYCYNFHLYCGKGSANEENINLLLGSQVVLNILTVVDSPFSYNVYFNNLFTDYALLVHLRNLGFNAMGTMRENRISKCLLKESNGMKKESRGTYDYRSDCNEDILIVK
ncbi:piggyBac transposable element-derived protein 3-like [Palaemon carinicauda]|uniref:piggyBac transposable element-derived protein 3-like n=1 Tax=Palaemon carinicauda TaxID=392227 RepID=UPI0035B57485